MTDVDLQDLTPNVIHVWRFSLDATPEETAALRPWLSDCENARLDRIRSRVKRDRRAVAWGRLRYILASYLDCPPQAIQVARTQFGRPEIIYPQQSGLRFSLSHSNSQGLVAVSKNAVGVDIERVDAAVNAERLATRFFTSYETEQLCDLPEEERCPDVLSSMGSQGSDSQGAWRQSSCWTLPMRV